MELPEPGLEPAPEVEQAATAADVQLGAIAV